MNLYLRQAAISASVVLPTGIFVGIRHNVPPISFPPGSPDPRRRSVARWANPLAITASAPAEESNADSDKNSSQGPQLFVQELIPAGWDMGMQAIVPAVAQSNYSQQQQSQQPYMSHQRQPSGLEQKSGRQGRQTLAGMLVHQTGDVRQQQERDAQGAPLMVSLEGWMSSNS